MAKFGLWLGRRIAQARSLHGFCWITVRRRRSLQAKATSYILVVAGPPRASAGPGADHFPGPFTSPPSPPCPPPFPFLPSNPLPSPSPSPPFLSLPSLSLEVGPLNPARGSGECCNLPQRGLGRNPSRN